MKNLYDEIRHEYFNILYKNGLIDYFGESNIPDSIDYKDPIFENLQTHDIQKLIDKINEFFSDDYSFVIEFVNSKHESIVIKSDDDIASNEKFLNLIEFFGYYISSVENKCILICPKYSKDANKLVCDNHYKLYHFTTGEHAAEIAKKGLRCKSAKYRYYPKRVYLYSSYKNLNNIHGIDIFINPIAVIHKGSMLAVVKRVSCGPLRQFPLGRGCQSLTVFKLRNDVG